MKDFDVEKIANSGEVFRLNKVSDDKYKSVYELISTDKYLNIVYDKKKNTYKYSCDKDEFKKIYKDYFDLDTDYSKYLKICKKDDKFLKDAIKYGEGLKILRQDKYEMLISFIISQRKSIKAIKTSIERICREAGKKIKNEFGIFYAFPTPKEILKNKIKLKSCGLGYRYPYIIEACERIASGEIKLDEYDKLSTEDLLKKLMTIKGVGEKVASCVALFAYHRLETCPMDVWMNRVLINAYHGKFPEEYIPYLGVLQQYMFYFAKEEHNVKKEY